MTAVKRKRKRVRPQTVQQVVFSRPQLTYSEIRKRDRQERLSGLCFLLVGLGVTTFIIWARRAGNNRGAPRLPRSDPGLPGAVSI